MFPKVRVESCRLDHDDQAQYITAHKTPTNTSRGRYGSDRLVALLKGELPVDVTEACVAKFCVGLVGVNEFCL